MDFLRISRGLTSFLTRTSWGVRIGDLLLLWSDISLPYLRNCKPLTYFGEAIIFAFCWLLALSEPPTLLMSLRYLLF